jgi:hypothetical protein
MTSLPFIDEHAVDVAASPDAVWRAVGHVMGRQSSPPVRLFAGTVLGTDPRGTTGEPLAVDSTIPGFRVATAVPRERVVYAGRHRFSQYELIFELAAHEDGTRLRALSYARFPGPHGRAYRALVISSGLHPKAVRHMLRSMAHAAESSTE